MIVLTVLAAFLLSIVAVVVHRCFHASLLAVWSCPASRTQWRVHLTRRWLNVLTCCPSVAIDATGSVCSGARVRRCLICYHILAFRFLRIGALVAYIVRRLLMPARRRFRRTISGALRPHVCGCLDASGAPVSVLSRAFPVLACGSGACSMACAAARTNL